MSLHIIIIHTNLHCICTQWIMTFGILEINKQQCQLLSKNCVTIETLFKGLRLAYGI